MKIKEELIDFAREALELPGESSIELIPFGGRGSDRAYYRLRWNTENSVILVHYWPGKIENTLFADIACFLLNNEIPVPRILRHDTAGCLILMQDLGNTDLASLGGASWKLRKNLYQKTLAIAHRLHSLNDNLFAAARVRLMDPFDPDLYRWERNYFLNYFVRGLCRIKLERILEQKLEAELAAMAGRLLSSGRSLVHRDLQSQNIMICNEAPFLIDFQGMRFGTQFYDLGSLLCDPYVDFSESERAELLSFYYDLSEADMAWEAFRTKFWEASAQRLMQALGAFGFLGLQRGLTGYLVNVPAGCRNLCMAAEQAASLPELLQVSLRCRKALAGEETGLGIPHLQA